ncbi:MFS transporter [Streptomyces sp. NPDC051561]|uniref:MFS transporter n=1 Tax=Streptomyces sp. NPDC051561 TaxID=3365658 RepID=UPI003799670F
MTGTGRDGAGTDLDEAGTRPGGAGQEQVDRRFRLLILGFALSSYGSFLNMVALNLFVYATTGSALSMGLFMAARLVSGVLGGMASSTLVDRFGTKSVMLWSNILQAAALFLLVLAPDAWRTGAVFASAVVAGACATVFMVALRSAIPDLVGEDRRDWANSLTVTGRSLAMVAGFASAGLVVSFLGYTAAFVIDGVSFLLCVAAVAALPSPKEEQDTTRSAQPQAAGQPGPRRAALVALAATPALLLMVCLRAVDAFGSSSHNAALPVYSSGLDPDSPAVFVSTFWCCWAIGNVLVQQVIRRRARRGRAAVGAVGFGVGTVVMSSAFILAFCGFPLVAAVAVALVAGGADGLTEVSYTGQLQTLPTKLRTEAFALSATVESLGFGIGMIAVSALLDSHGPLPVVAWSHGAAIALALVFLAVVVLRKPRLAPPEPAGNAPGTPAEETPDAERSR